MKLNICISLYYGSLWIVWVSLNFTFRIIDSLSHEKTYSPFALVTWVFHLSVKLYFPFSFGKTYNLRLFVLFCSFSTQIFLLFSCQRSLSHQALVGLDGLEPSTSRLSGARSSHLSYKPRFQLKDSMIRPSRFTRLRSLSSLLPSCDGREPFAYFPEPKPRRSRWWRWRESNPWPPACRAGALPAELHPHKGFAWLFQWSADFSAADHWQLNNKILSHSLARYASRNSPVGL